MFERGAREDAGRFLELADSYDADAPLTLYNRARLAAFKGRVDKAVEFIDDIQLPEKKEHPAWLQWHLDNFSSYSADSKLQHIFVQTNNHFHLKIYEKLNMCAEQAQKYIDERGGSDGMWSEKGLTPEAKKQFRYTKALMAGCGAGIATLTFIGQLDADTAQSALAFLQSLFDNLDLIASADASVLQESITSASAAMGDGGWASVINYDEGLVAATFGDGGWA